MKFGTHYAYTVTYGMTEIWQNGNESTFCKNFVTLFQIPVSNMKPMHLSYVQLLLLVKLKP